MASTPAEILLYTLAYFWLIHAKHTAVNRLFPMQTHSDDDDTIYNEGGQWKALCVVCLFLFRLKVVVAGLYGQWLDGMQ